jgi:hypothetical protein
MENKGKKKSLEDRIIEFEKSIRKKAEGVWHEELIEDFLDFWTEHNENAKRFRAEREKIFDIGKRLARWNRQSRKIYKPVVKTDEIARIREKAGL